MLCLLGGRDHFVYWLELEAIRTNNLKPRCATYRNVSHILTGLTRIQHPATSLFDLCTASTTTPTHNACKVLPLFHAAAHLFLELSGQEVHQSVVKIFSSQECVPIGRLHLKHTLLDLQNGNIKGSSSQIKHGYPENKNHSLNTGTSDHPCPENSSVPLKKESRLSFIYTSNSVTTQVCYTLQGEK